MKDFERSAKVVLVLVKGALAVGAGDEAAEKIRYAMVQAFEQGAESSRKAQRLVHS